MLTRSYETQLVSKVKLELRLQLLVFFSSQTLIIPHMYQAPPPQADGQPVT